MVKIQRLILICSLPILTFVVAVAQENRAEPPDGQAVESINLGEVVVTGEKQYLSAIAPNSSVEIISREEIRELPAGTVPELLEYVAGLDVRRRGAGGVQADVGIRGSGFNRVAVLVNGIRMNDPQTGHHNMDIPVNVEDIERIEILRGQGAHIYGSGAMAGAINIVTAGADSPEDVEIESAGGKFGQRRFGASYSKSALRLSATRESSDGFRYDTDYADTTVFAQGSPLGGNVDVTAGWNEKDFGANEFYVPGWPSREKTRTGFLNAAYIDNDNGGKGLRADAWYRSHYDRFDCSVKNLSLCSNRHRTHRGGAEVERLLNLGSGILSIGMLGERDRIVSSNIGRRSSGHSAAYARYAGGVSDRLRMAAGLRADKHAGYSSRWSWSAGAGYLLTGISSLRITAGRAYRVPTFTELYYGDPAHVSFSGLAPETSFSVEIGLDVNTERMDFELSHFRSEYQGLIDWTRANPAAAWVIGNHSGVRFAGVSAGIDYRMSETFSWSLSYDRLSIETGSALDFKYTDTKPVSAARAGFAWIPGGGYTLSIGATYDKVKGTKNVALADAQVRKAAGRTEYYLRVNNIFDRSYEDVSGVPMPGMALVLGAEFRLEIN